MLDYVTAIVDYYRRPEVAETFGRKGKFVLPIDLSFRSVSHNTKGNFHV